MATVGSVLFPGDQEDRHRTLAQFGQPGPKRLLGALPGQAQARGQAGGGVDQPLVDAPAAAGSVGEEGLGQPPGEEALDPVGLDPVGEGLRRRPGGPAWSALVLDPGRRC